MSAKLYGLANLTLQLYLRLVQDRHDRTHGASRFAWNHFLHRSKINPTRPVHRDLWYVAMEVHDAKRSFGASTDLQTKC